MSDDSMAYSKLSSMFFESLLKIPALDAIYFAFEKLSPVAKRTLTPADYSNFIENGVSTFKSLRLIPAMQTNVKSAFSISCTFFVSRLSRAANSPSSMIL